MSNQPTYMRRAHGSFGSRNGQRWSKELATANDRAKPSDLAAGTFGSVDRIEPHIVKRAIEAQLCPWCGAGPYKVIAAHTNKAHGIDRAELRRLAGVPQKSSICDPAYSEAQRAGVMSRPDWEETTKKANKASVAVGSYSSASKARVKKHAEENTGRDSEIVQAVLSGDFRVDVARRFGVGPRTVTAVLRKAGIADDGREQAAKLRWDEDKQQALVAAVSLAAEAKRAERVERFEYMGGNWTALEVMAAMEGKTRRQMAAILRHAGATVPDGRSVSPHRRVVQKGK